MTARCRWSAEADLTPKPQPLFPARLPEYTAVYLPIVQLLPPGRRHSCMPMASYPAPKTGFCQLLLPSRNYQPTTSADVPRGESKGVKGDKSPPLCSILLAPWCLQGEPAAGQTRQHKVWQGREARADRPKMSTTAAEPRAPQGKSFRNLHSRQGRHKTRSKGPQSGP